MANESSIPAALIEEHQRLVSELDARAESSAFRREKIAVLIKACDNEDKDIAARRATLADLLRMYESIYSTSKGGDGEVPKPVAKPPEEVIGQKRARIGPQRYLMLNALHERGPLTVHDIAGLASLAPRRVRDQMVADEKNKIVELVTQFVDIGKSIAKYQITSEGRQLLHRFVAYRHERGIPLPTIEDAEDDSFTQEDAEEMAAEQARELAYEDETNSEKG
jgi:hypothetical protein